MYTKNQLSQLHNELCNDALKLMLKKNADCAGDTDPFANFRGSNIYNVPPEIGILIRIGDKLKRVESLVRAGNLQVKDQSVRDSIVDIINYAVLLYGMTDEQKQSDAYSPDDTHEEHMRKKAIDIANYEQRQIGTEGSTWNKEKCNPIELGTKRGNNTDSTIDKRRKGVL